MLTKIKNWLFEGVILKKVAGKFAKHAVGALVAFFASKPILNDTGILIDWAQFETWVTIALVGLFGSGWNYIEHRFVKKSK